MNEKNFTPGPWRVRVYGEEYEGIGVEDQHGQEICDCFEHNPWPVYGKPGIDGDEKEANAHLIAAAPEMYYALQDAINALSKYEGTAEVYIKIEAVRQKARGEV